MKKSLLVGLLASVLVLSFASIALAQLPTEIKQPPKVETFAEASGIINQAMNVIFTVLLIGAALFIIVAAFQFLTAGGDAEQLTQARSKIIWALVAIVVAVLAKGIPTIIATFLKVTPATP